MVGWGSRVTDYGPSRALPLHAYNECLHITKFSPLLRYNQTPLYYESCRQNIVALYSIWQWIKQEKAKQVELFTNQGCYVSTVLSLTYSYIDKT